jgi:hypothetical protein
MTHAKTQSSQSTWRIILRSMCMTALAGVLTTLLPPLAQAENPGQADVPPDLQVPAGNRAFLTAHAVGTQNYICLPSGAGLAWTFLGPQATLVDRHGRQIATHFLSPNPDEGGTPRATWQHSHDTSAVWAVAIVPSSDPRWVAPGAIPWLLLDVVGAEDGPTRGDRLSDATFIQRVRTEGGVMPAGGCTQVGQRAMVPYTTDYIFYKSDGRRQ